MITSAMTATERYAGQYTDESAGPWPRQQEPPEEINHRNTKRTYEAKSDAQSERVEAKVDVVAVRALEGGPVPTVSPLPRADDLFRQRGLGVEIWTENAVGMALRVLEIDVGIDREVDLVEDLSVGR